MKISKLIVHEIKKESKNVNVQRITSNELIPVDDDSEQLVSALLKSYSGDKILYADFNSDPERVFPAKFRTYRTSERSDNEFIKFTTEAIANLEQFIRTKFLARGGYLVFAEYVSDHIPYLTIFLIRDTEGKLLQRSKNTFKIKTVEYLDTNHLAMACRINETKIDAKESNYLSFTRHRQQDVSDYFTDWISVEQLESSTEFTKALYTIINAVPCPTNAETNQPFEIDEVRHMVYENAKSNARKNINIHSISEQIFGDPTTISSYAERNGISIDTEFRYDEHVLKKFVQLKVNRDGVSLKFSRDDSGTKVRISEENPNIVLIESKKFADALRDELNYNERR